MINRISRLNATQRQTLEQSISTTTDLLAQCEYLIRSPIPLSYTRTAVRFLWLWMTLLPFALVRTFSEFGRGTWWEDRGQITVPATVFFIGIIFLSIEDIAVQIEEPFSVQRRQLEKLSEWFRQEALELREVAAEPCDFFDPIDALGAEDGETEGALDALDMVDGHP
ncbi:unnamed protein product [Polarella glacialis]|uniref:Bestrophin homolog n=1 Tax=Polarella glacialis TaxID=89957 RepID=A0A813IK33_POLGL|nr:unnamed protein product [Polarella glacialis]